MTRAPEQTVDPHTPGDEHDEDDRGLEFSGRSVLTLCGFLAAMILGLYLLLPQLAGLEDTWERIEDGSFGVCVGQPLERRDKESCVQGHTLDLGVGLHDKQHTVPCGGGRGKHRLCRRCETRNPRRTRTHPDTASGSFQQSSKGE